MQFHVFRVSCLAAILFVTTAVDMAQAEVRLPAIFGSHMVLQRDMPVPIWGWADAGEKVTVKFGDQSKTATTDSDGKWRVKLDPLSVGDARPLVVAGTNEITLDDVLVGEVWIGSGQSNMAWTVSRSANPKEEIAAADHPKLRLFTVTSRGAKQPADNCTGSWGVCSPKNAGNFSATLYYFGREVHKALDVPVGLINSSVGGTPIERWAGAEGYQNDLYNGKIAPLASFAIAGAIWYQGESNAGRGAQYHKILTAMVQHWRKVWGQGDFPFYWVQLPNFRKKQAAPSEMDGWVLVREGMLQALSLPNTGMAVTLDIGEANNIHPQNKQDVGRRLALWALGQKYGKEIVYSGPIYRGMTKKGGKLVISFDHIGGGLTSGENPRLEGFAIAGEDKQFVWAEAAIEGETVVVSSGEVKDPVAVRYAWATNPTFNLANKDGLLASPFRTDDWDK